jgi:hypothetical protein
MWTWAVAWGLREIGSAWERGVREGPAPWEAGKIRGQCPTNAGIIWSRTRKTNQVGRDDGGSA